MNPNERLRLPARYRELRPWVFLSVLLADQHGSPEGWRAIRTELLYWPQLEVKELKQPRGGPNTDQHMLAHMGGFV